METSVECRKENGQFKQGFSGNPGGRPKDEHKVAELARSYTLEAVETYIGALQAAAEVIRGQKC